MATQHIRYNRRNVSDPTLPSKSQGFLCVRPKQTCSRSTERFPG